MSSFRRRIRRSDLLLLLLPALLTFSLLVLPSHGSLTAPANTRIGARQQIEASADCVIEIGWAHERCDAPEPPATLEPPVREFHDMVATTGTARAARAPSLA